MTPEEQQYQWMRNRAALKALGLEPSDLWQYASSSTLGLSENPIDKSELLAGQNSPYSARQSLLSQVPSELKTTLGNTNPQNQIAKESFLGDALIKMFLGSNLPAKPVTAFRATPPTLR